MDHGSPETHESPAYDSAPPAYVPSGRLGHRTEGCACSREGVTWRLRWHRGQASYRRTEVDFPVTLEFLDPTLADTHGLSGWLTVDEATFTTTRRHLDPAAHAPTADDLAVGGQAWVTAAELLMFHGGLSARLLLDSVLTPPDWPQA